MRMLLVSKHGNVCYMELPIYHILQYVDKNAMTLFIQTIECSINNFELV